MEGQTQKETITVEFQSADNSADAMAVGSTMTAVTALINRVHMEYDKDRKFLVKARPFGKGSLDVPIEIVIFVGAPLFHDLFFQRIRDILSQYLSLKLRLYGQSFQVKDGNVIIVENDTIHVDQLSLQLLQPGSLEDDLFTRAFDCAEADPDIEAVRILSSNQSLPVIDIPRKDFHYYQEPITGEDLSMPTAAGSREIIIIRSVSFDPTLSWRFEWRGIRFAARIIDEEFWKRIHARKEVFADGDRMIVDLSRVQEYDPKTGTHLEKAFAIKQVIKHVKRTENDSMF